MPSRLRLEDLAGFGLVDDPKAVLGRIGYATGLAEALDGAAYVQESTPERVEVKREVYAELDRLAAPDAILASSTSGIPASASPSTSPGGIAAWSRIRSTRRS